MLHYLKSEAIFAPMASLKTLPSKVCRTKIKLTTIDIFVLPSETTDGRVSFLGRRTGDSAVGIATGHGSEFKYRKGQEFSLHVVETGYGAHPASYPMGTRGYFPGGKATGA
jgi:hypothetical protein